MKKTAAKTARKGVDCKILVVGFPTRKAFLDPKLRKIRLSKCPLIIFTGFGGEEGLFAGEAPAVAGEAAVLANDAVARHDDRDRIGGASAGDGADGFFAPDGAGDLAVGARRAPGDAAEFFPDAALEGGGLHVEREIAMRLFAAEMAEDFADPGAEARGVGANLGARIFTDERGLKLRL